MIGAEGPNCLLLFTKAGSEASPCTSVYVLAFPIGLSYIQSAIGLGSNTRKPDFPKAR